MLSAFRARRTRTTRDSMVGSSASGSDVVSTITVSAGGSSSALSRALAAASAPIWGTRRSASPTMKTLCCPNAGVSASRRNSSRTDAIPWLASHGIASVRLLTARGHLVGERLRHEIKLFVGVGALLRELDRHEPMHVRVRQARHQLTSLALPTRFPRPLLLGFSPTSTQQRLRQPQAQALFPDTAWPL